MQVQAQTAIIIGASLNGLIAAKSISELFKDIIILEKQSPENITPSLNEALQALSDLPNVHILFNTKVRGYVCKTSGELVGVSIQEQDHHLEHIHAQVIIDASSTESYTPFWLQCLGYEAVSYSEKELVISSPRTQTVTIRAYNYHKMTSLPQGLFIIGDVLSNIAMLSGQQDKLAMIQATLLKQYLSSTQDNLQFQKNVALIVSILIKEYVHMAKGQVKRERHLDTLRQVINASH
jgi:thioredoxin reductase